MAIYDKSTRGLMRQMVTEMPITPGQVVTKDAVLNWFATHYPKIKEGTVAAHLIRLSTNAPSRLHYSAKPGDDDVFFQLDGSHFRLYHPANDPPPIQSGTAKTNAVTPAIVLVSITLDDLERASANFRQLEKRGSFYDMALRLVQAGYEIEGCVLLLATWNFASFRYAATNFDIWGLKTVLSGLQSDFAALTDDIQSLDLTKHSCRIERMFNSLASMKEVLYTGATKLMHLKCPKTFVIWDDYIRGGKPKKLYDSLSCVSSKKWHFHEYEKNGKGYVEFLSDIQSRFHDLQYPKGSKTLAKAIDEFNYVNVTLPIQEIKSKQRAEKKKEKSR